MISIIVPVYNIQSDLARCMESLLRQSYADFEVLLVDDGSDDESNKVCREYAERDKRISVISLEHTGVGGARNAGLKQAKGEYITFVDGDDVVHNRYLETLLALLTRTESDVAICTYRIIHGEPHPDDDAAVAIDDSCNILLRDKLIENIFDGYVFRTVTAKLYKKAVIGSAEFDKFDFAEDMEFNSRVFQRVKRAAFISAPLYTWVMRGDSKCNAEFSLRRLDNLYSIRKVYNRLKADNEAYAGFALKRLYKDMLILRYEAPREYLPRIKAEISETVEATRADLFRRVATFDYLTTMLFMRFPATYRAFRYVMAKRAGQKKH